MRNIFLFVLLVPLCHASFAQRFTVSGGVRDSTENASMIGVNLMLRQVRDTTQSRGAVTDLDGKFEFRNVRPGAYILKITYIGYATQNKRIVVRGNTDLGVIKIAASYTNLKDVEITGTQIRVQQKGDTVQYNADAFKTTKDASAEDLISKMPGITSDETGIKAQGENVQQVLVDGKQFFGDDAALALKNLPAEVIDKIEVFDRLSEQSQFTGFDDGNTRKTINIVTKKGRNNGQFGKLYAGAGENGRYITGGNVNTFKGDRKLSILGLSNNINQQNFSTEDLLGVAGNNNNNNQGGGGGRGSRGNNSGGGRGPSNNFLVGQQTGISSTHAFGLNYSNEWSDKVEVSGSYFFNKSDNDRNTNLARSFITQQDSGLLYTEKNRSSSLNYNHRFNVRLELEIDSSNSIVISPRLSLQQNESSSVRDGDYTTEGNIAQSTIDNSNRSDNLGYNFSNNFQFRHRFAKRGRSVSWNLGIELNDREGTSGLQSLSEYFSSDDTTILIDQRADQFTSSRNVSSEISFTEPIGKLGQLQINYTASLTRSDTDKKTFNRDIESDLFLNLDTLLTNTYNNTYFSNRGGISYRFNNREVNFMAGVNFQHATLSSNQEFPTAFQLERSFQNLLPQIRYNYRFSQSRNLRINYRTSTNAPSVSQLQNVVDNRNPLFLRTGNPDLKQDYQHNLTLRYGNTSQEKSSSFLVFLYGNYVRNYIGNATFIAPTDTVYNNVPLTRGTQLSYLVNVPENWNARTFVTYGFPITAIKSNLNFNTGFNYNRTPAFINSAKNLAHNYAFNEGVVLSSNINEKLDFTLSYTANYVIVKNTLNAQSDNNYFSHVSSLRLNWQFWKGFVLNSNLTNTLYSGLSAEFDQQIWFWNAAFGYKFLKEETLEVKVTAFDILGQNNNINREVTETFIEDSQTNVLTRYFMLMVTYSLRNFK